MPVKLDDPAKIEELAHIVESDGPDSALEGFIHSLALPEEQESIIVASLAQLPSRASGKVMLPSKSPDLVRMAFWS